ncbi:hypothetical protein Tsubulata_040164 [Turnera subulata]|uniref:F-box domain-containing protein n=1 Tax=Turnera subulata TaxID=218843 RepID=A0A9Q0F6N4_9ROSI|nr:hypothetical protein Tsubulata_040164 [Turnera subulata]
MALLVGCERTKRRPPYDWSSLPRDILEEISKRITCVEDFVAFRGVCRLWRAGAAKENFKHNSPPQVPRLIFLSRRGQNCVDITKSKTYKLGINLLRRDDKPRNKLRTSGGIRGIRLPLAYYNIGDQAWTMVVPMDDSGDIYTCLSVLCFRGKFYCSCYCHRTEKINILETCILSSGAASKPKAISDELDDRVPDAHVLYLVESAGYLLFVTWRYVSLSNYELRIFQVDVENGKCEELSRLGNRALFLSDGYTCSIDALDEYGYGHLANSIFITAACRFRRSAYIRVYNMLDHTPTKLNPVHTNGLWIQPCLD